MIEQIYKRQTGKNLTEIVKGAAEGPLFAAFLAPAYILDKADELESESIAKEAPKSIDYFDLAANVSIAAAYAYAATSAFMGKPGLAAIYLATNISIGSIAALKNAETFYTAAKNKIKGEN